MAQPTFVPITEADQVRSARRLSVPGAWVANRPGDLAGPGRPSGTRFGTPGPDQGFALALAHRFENRLELTDAESVEDVLLGGAVLASKRAGLLGRAPCIYDLEAAFELFGFLTASPPEELVAERRRLFRSVAHDYVAQRSLADAVPDAALVLKADELRSKPGEWRVLPADTSGGEPQTAGHSA
jgi:hypothetical protein